MSKIYVLLFLNMFYSCTGQPFLGIDTFGKDDYTQTLMETIADEDWTNRIGNNLYKKMIIYNREFSRIYNNIDYPEVPYTPDFNIILSGGKSTVYNLNLTSKIILCLDKDLISNCNYITSVDVIGDVATAIYSVVIYNQNEHYNTQLGEWYLKNYTKTQNISPNDPHSFLITPTALIDIPSKENLINCSQYSNIIYASVASHDSIYPVNPCCYQEHGYIQSTSSDLYPSFDKTFCDKTDSGSNDDCKNLTHAMYNDPGYIENGPLVLEWYNAYDTLNIIIAGTAFNDFGKLHNLYTNLSINIPLYNSSLDILKLTCKNTSLVCQNAFPPIELEYGYCTCSVRYFTGNYLEQYYFISICNELCATNSVSNSYTPIIIFNYNTNHLIFAPISYSSASIIASLVYINPKTNDSADEAVAVLGQLSDMYSLYLKTKTYCLSDISFNIPDELKQKLHSYAHNVSTLPEGTDLYNKWLQGFATFLTGCVLGAAAPIACSYKNIIQKRCMFIVSFLLLIGVLAASTVVSIINLYSVVYASPLTNQSSLAKIDSYITDNNYTIISITHINYDITLSETLIVVGWTIPPIAFFIVLLFNLSLCTLSNGKFYHVLTLVRRCLPYYDQIYNELKEEDIFTKEGNTINFSQGITLTNVTKILGPAGSANLDLQENTINGISTINMSNEGSIVNLRYIRANNNLSICNNVDLQGNILNEVSTINMSGEESIVNNINKINGNDLSINNVNRINDIPTVNH